MKSRTGLMAAALMVAMLAPANALLAVVTLVEAEDLTNVTYTGTWQTRTKDTDNATDYILYSKFPQVYGGQIRRATAAGAKATLQFTGQSVSGIFITGMSTGMINVKIDGVDKGNFSLYNNTYWTPPSWQMYFGACYYELVFATNLTNGPHTLEVTVLSTKPFNWAECGTQVNIDAFRYGDFAFGTIKGTVTDADGDGIHRVLDWKVANPVEAKVTLTGPQTYVRHLSDDGTYTLSGIAAGTYSVTVQAPGFKSVTKTGVQIAAGQEATVDFQMGIGADHALYNKVHYPRAGTPYLKLPDGTFEIAVNAAAGATTFTANLRTQYNTYPLTITNAVYDDAKNWTLTAKIPASIPEELYDLQVNWQQAGARTDTSVRAVKVYKQFKSEYYFIHHTDPQGAPADFTTVVNEVNLINPEFVITTGDNIPGPWRPGTNEWDWNKWNEFLPPFNSHRVPTFSAPGNHCAGPGVTMMSFYYKQFVGRRYWAQRYGNHLVLSLDNTIFNLCNAYKFDRAKYWDVREKWTISQLQANSDATLRILAVHVGMDNFTDLPGNSWYQAMKQYGTNGAWLDQYNISYMAYGHWGQDTVSKMSPSNAPMVETRDISGAKAYRLIRVSNNQIGAYTYNGDAKLSMTAGSLSISYAQTNNGTAETNTATIVNNFYERFQSGLVKFVMKKGSYSVTGTPGTARITQSVDSDNGLYTIVYVNYDIPSRSTSTVTIEPAGKAVAACHVFYNNSKFDGNNPAATAADDAAIATDKTPLRPGQTATFANYTSCVQGLTGIMIDIPELPGTPTAADFVFKLGNSNIISNWSPFPPPSSITVRPGAGVDGSDRITLIYSDYWVQKQWLQVTVKATAATGLTRDEVFYFGNAVGESGNSTASARVDTADVIAARSDLHKTFMNPASVTNNCDYNRDGRVNTTDEIIARQNATNVTNELKLIAAP